MPDLPNSGVVAPPPGHLRDMAAHLANIVIDCQDPDQLATFWQHVLGWEHREVDDDGVEIGDGAPGGVAILFERVRERKAGKNRVHIDVRPRGCDQASELARLRQLGARLVDVGQEDVSWVVLADPEGNEFCLLRTPIDELEVATAS